ncbi:MAG: protein BatD [Deltaproteobacteria bacterium]|nr:protein BatD [Deltaproteobacteria bacterium]
MKPAHAIAVALALVLVTSGVASAQQATIATSVDRKKVELGDDLELSITVSGRYDELVQPTVSDFEVVSQGMQTVISGRQQQLTRTYVLRPKKSGTLTISKATLMSGGQVVAEAPPISIVVTEPAAATPIDGADAQDPARMAGEAVFIRYATPRSRFFVGEPFPLTLELWLQDGLGYAGAELVRGPKFDGLLVEDLPERPSVRPKTRRLGQTRYAVYELSVMLATPLKAGSLLVDAATLRINVSEDGWALSAKRVSRTTQPFTLDVREVPEAGRPASFRPSNVGVFAVKARLADDRGQEPQRIKVGQRLVLRAEVTGRGNLAALEAPVVDAPGFEVRELPSSGEDRIDKDASGVSGTRVFQWLVSAKAPGNQPGPGLALGWWDPDKERFDEARVPGKPLEVTGSAAAADTADATSLGEDVGPIAEAAALTGERSTPPAESPLYWALVALPVVGWVVVEVRWRRRRSDLANPGQRLSKGAGTNAKKRLRAAEQALKDGLVKDFYGQLARTLTSYLEERANIPATGMTHDQVRATATRVGYPADLVDAVVVEMENCDFARFAPSGSASEKMREAHARVSGIIESLDRIHPERRP